MYMRPGEKAKYGYNLRNYFTGEIIAERKFDTRAEMEAGLAEDLAPDKLLGSAFRNITAAETEVAPA